MEPLLLDGWLEFNRLKWGVRPLRLYLRAPGADLPSLEAVLYLDRRGRVRLPRLNPYLGIAFRPTATPVPHRQTNQWLDLAGALAAEMRRRGLVIAALPPECADARPWRWAGLHVGVKYTYLLDFPLAPLRPGGSVQQNINRAQKLGYTCRRITDLRPVFTCLQETEARQGFRHHLSLGDLQLAAALLGDHLRAYACYAPDGDLANACMILCAPGGRAVGWVKGMRTAHARSGANQLLDAHTFADAAAAGASGFDFAGANIPSVAATKAVWGARLAPFYTVQPYGLRPLARWLRDWWRSATTPPPG